MASLRDVAPVRVDSAEDEADRVVQVAAERVNEA